MPSAFFMCGRLESPKDARPPAVNQPTATCIMNRHYPVSYTHLDLAGRENEAIFGLTTPEVDALRASGQYFAWDVVNSCLLYTSTLAFYQMTHPGAKLTFMGDEIGQQIEWRYYESIRCV